MQFLGRQDSDVLDEALSTAVTVTDTVTSTGDIMIASATLSAPALTPEDFLILSVFRDANAGGDTVDADVGLLAVELQE